MQPDAPQYVMYYALIAIRPLPHSMSSRRMKRILSPFLLLASACLFGACGGSDPASEDAPPPLFTRLSAAETGVDFVNRLEEQDAFNVLEYEYFYNGGGVAVGDVNGDGLPDLYLSANMFQDRLYLNRGGLTFEDATEAAGLASELSWTTGVVMADANGDGHLDIYVCKSGRVSEDRRRNALYVNDGDGTFTERAAEYGLDDPAYSNHAVFFDYDRDGDLDLYLLNHSIRRLSRFDVEYMRTARDALAGDKLYRNDGGRFTDASEAAGIIGNPLGFGLSAIAGDVNRDGWPDLYVSNDYIEDDYLYVNGRDGTFVESARDAYVLFVHGRGRRRRKQRRLARYRDAGHAGRRSFSAESSERSGRPRVLRRFSQ